MSDGDGWFDGFDPLSALLIGFLLADQRDTTVGHHHRDYWSDGPMRTVPPTAQQLAAMEARRRRRREAWTIAIGLVGWLLRDIPWVTLSLWTLAVAISPAARKALKQVWAAARANRGGGQKLPSTTYLSSASSRAAPSAPRRTLALLRSTAHPSTPRGGH